MRIFNKKNIDVFFVYNLDVFLMYGSIAFLLIQKMAPFHPNSINIFSIFVANILYIVSVYTLNKVSDTPEDSLNRISGHTFNNHTIHKLSLLFFLVSLLLYLIPGKIEFLLSGCLLWLLGLLYSFPKKYRLKNVFIIKNLTPAFCWFFSLCLIIYSGNLGLRITDIMKLLSPMLFLFFTFEIIWDMPDCSGDKAHGIRTLPGVIGFNATRYVLCGLLGIIFLLTSSPLNMIICLLLASFVITVAEKTEKIMYHYSLFLLVLIYVTFSFFEISFRAI